MPSNIKAVIHHYWVAVLAVVVALAIGAGPLIYFAHANHSSSAADSGGIPVSFGIILAAFILENVLMLVGVFVLASIQRHWIASIAIVVVLLPFFGCVQFIVLFAATYCEHCGALTFSQGLERAGILFFPGVLFLAAVVITLAIRRGMRAGRVTNNARAALGFLLSPLAAAALSGYFDHGFFALEYSLLVPYFFVILFGVPSYMMLRRLGWLHFWQVLLAGAALGAVAYFGWLSTTTLGLRLTIGVMVSGAIHAMYGLVVAVAFWWISLRSSPPKLDGPISSN